MIRRFDRRSAALVVGVALLVLGGFAFAMGGAGAPASGAPDGEAPAADHPDDVARLSGDAGADPSADNTVTRIRVYPNGSALWTVKTRTRLDSEQRLEEYRAFQERVRNNASRYLEPFERRITRVVDRAGNETGREMEARAFDVSTSIQEVPRQWGVVTHEFVWDGFARTDGDALVVGDVFQGGFFLAANDTLELRIPDEFAATEVAPDPDDDGDDVLRWEGRQDFADGRPSARLVPESARTTTTPAGAGDGDDTGAGDGDGGGDGGGTQTGGDESGGTLPFAVAGLGIVLVVALGVAYVVRNGHVDALPTQVGDADDDDTDEDDEDEDRADEPVLLTDEDRVENLLEDRDGQMRQAEVADELDWSSSKTSRVLSGMADEDRIEKIRIGRENVIRFPEDEEDEDPPEREWG